MTQGVVKYNTLIFTVSILLASENPESVCLLRFGLKRPLFT